MCSPSAQSLQMRIRPLRDGHGHNRHAHHRSFTTTPHPYLGNAPVPNPSSAAPSTALPDCPFLHPRLLHRCSPLRPVPLPPDCRIPHSPLPIYSSPIQLPVLIYREPLCGLRGCTVEGVADGVGCVVHGERLPIGAIGAMRQRGGRGRRTPDSRWLHYSGQKRCSRGPSPSGARGHDRQPARCPLCIAPSPCRPCTSTSPPDLLCTT